MSKETKDPTSKNIINGYAFEYAIVESYRELLIKKGINVIIEENTSFEIIKSCYNKLSDDEKKSNKIAAGITFDTISELEPLLITQTKLPDDILKIRVNSAQDGQNGDVRDVIFSRPKINWEFGISAKNNNESIKHPRISKNIDFCKEWMGTDDISVKYISHLEIIFDYLSIHKGKEWAEMCEGFKENYVYSPLLDVFKAEMIRILSKKPYLSKDLISFIIGRNSFYKIKKSNNKIVTIKAFNIDGSLNKKSIIKTPKLPQPTRLIEFNYKDNSENTLIMTLDEGWQISFRIHNASSKIENSLKFDIKLIGNPPEIFTQNIF